MAKPTVKNPFTLNEFELVSEEAVDDRIPESDEEDEDDKTEEEAQREADSIKQSLKKEQFGDMDENEALVKVGFYLGKL